MRILLSNDDGVDAPGLAILAETLSTIADIDVIAPDRNRSGASNSLTLSRPLRVSRRDNGFFCIDGTPTDCVHLGIAGQFIEQPDMVVSGINIGSNLGDDILYSGTVAAAIEGRFLGLPAIAVSLVCNDNNRDHEHYHTAAQVIKSLVVRIQNEPLPAQTILNVNVPDVPLDSVKGYQVARLGSRHKAESVIKETDPRGGEIYWFGLPGPEADAGTGTDFHAIKDHYVSITPILLDLTHYQAFEQLSGWTYGLDLPAILGK